MINEIYTNTPNFSKFGSPVCSQVDPELFFPQENYDHLGNPLKGRYENANYAKTLCQSCPYKMACFSYAMERPDLVGIWGGTTEIDRINTRRRLRRRENYRIRAEEFDVK